MFDSFVRIHFPSLELTGQDIEPRLWALTADKVRNQMLDLFGSVTVTHGYGLYRMSTDKTITEDIDIYESWTAGLDATRFAKVLAMAEELAEQLNQEAIMIVFQLPGSHAMAQLVKRKAVS